MAQITGGKVSVEDSKPHSNDEYGRKKVLVELSFAVGDGEDYTGTFDLASEAASNRVNALLNGVSLRAVSPAAPTEAPPAGEPQRRVRRTKAQIEADEAAKRAGTAGTSSGASGGGASTGGGTPADDPAAIGGDDPTGGEEHVVHLPDESESFDIEPEPETPAEESFDIEPEPEAGGDPITDADLNSAVQKKNAEIADPNAIRALIGSYNPDPKAAFQLRQIDPAKRAEFLTKLGALKKAG